MKFFRSAAIILPSCQTGMLEKLANHQTLIPIDMTSHSRSEISKPEISPKPYILTRYNNSLNPSMTSYVLALRSCNFYNSKI